MVLFGDGAEHGIRLDELDLGGDKLVGVVEGHARGVLANDGGGHLAIDIDGGGGFVDRSQAGGDNDGGSHTAENEADNLPAVAAENPEVVRERDASLVGRFRVVAVIRGLDRL